MCKMQYANDTLEPVYTRPFSWVQTKNKKDADAACATMNNTMPTFGGDSIISVCYAEKYKL